MSSPAATPTLSVLASRASISAIEAQGTTTGRTIVLGPATNDGVLLGYGDYSANTGPIDIIAMRPDGSTATLLHAFDTEQIIRYRVLNGGAVWTTSVDPRGSGSGSVATNLGGTWHTIPVGVAGLPVAVHLFDIAQLSTGRLLVCGSRHLDGFADDEGMAMVWTSTDNGTTWTEELAYPGSGSDDFNRFYTLVRVGDDVYAQTSNGSGYHSRQPSGAWAHNDGQGPIEPMGEYLQGMRVSRAPDGTGYVTDGNTIYRINPPT